MDDFHKANTGDYTANDLNWKCVSYKPKARKKLKKAFIKKARRRVNRSTLNSNYYTVCIEDETQKILGGNKND